MKMSNRRPDHNNTRPNIAFWSLGVVILLFLFLAAGYVGYFLGKTSVSADTVSLPTPEPVVEVQEITREVTREVTVEVTSTAAVIPPTIELVQPPDVPDAVETAVPFESITSPEQTTDDAEGANFDIYNEVWSYVVDEFDGPLPEENRRMYAAISGSLETLNDEYTRFLRPDVAQRMREDMDGSVSGIGAFVRENDEGLIEIVRPIDDQPADLAGLLPGDVIVAIDDEEVVGLDFDEVLLRVRGPEGSTIKLTIIRQGEDEPLEFEIVRALFEVPVVQSEMLGSEDFPIAYVQLSSFTRNAETAVIDALRALLEQNPQAIIFDLRDNGGGFLDQAVAIADIFLAEGVVLHERNNDDIDKTFESDNGDLGESLPLVVLVNSGSASASEIVAGAIQDRDRGTLIGESTFGKGSVQLVHNLSDGSELRVTIARWYTPNNSLISEKGIAPDIEIPSPLDLGGENDTQLQRAIEWLQEGE